MASPSGEGGVYFAFVLRSRLWRGGFAGLLLVVVWVFGFQAIRQFRVARLSADPTIDNLRRAIAVGPDRAESYNLLAEDYLYSVAHYDPGVAATYLRRAVELNPHVAVYWLNLARAYQGQGRSADALGALRIARKQDPSNPSLAWALGNFYANGGAVRPALQAWKEAILGDPSYVSLAFELGWKLAPDTSALLEDLVPDSAEMDFRFLDFLLRKKVDDPAPVWNRIVRRGKPFPPSWAKEYLELFILRQDPATARKVWGELLRVAVPDRKSEPGNLVNNGGFEEELLDMGLDWRPMVFAGIAGIVLDNGVAYEGRRSVRIDFDGTENFHYEHFFQYVPVESGRRYVVTASVRAQGITSSSGPRLRVYDPFHLNAVDVSGTPVFQTSGWVQDRLEFTIPPVTRFVRVSISRPVSTKFNPNIRGSVWLDGVRMVEVDSGSKP